jgi:hypothetical protein
MDRHRRTTPKKRKRSVSPNGSGGGKPTSKKPRDTAPETEADLTIPLTEAGLPREPHSKGFYEACCGEKHSLVGRTIAFPYAHAQKLGRRWCGICGREAYRNWAAVYSGTSFVDMDNFYNSVSSKDVQDYWLNEKGGDENSVADLMAQCARFPSNVPYMPMLAGEVAQYNERLRRLTEDEHAVLCEDVEVGLKQYKQKRIWEKDLERALQAARESTTPPSPNYWSVGDCTIVVEALHPDNVPSAKEQHVAAIDLWINKEVDNARMRGGCKAITLVFNELTVTFSDGFLLAGLRVPPLDDLYRVKRNSNALSVDGVWSLHLIVQ